MAVPFFQWLDEVGALHGSLLCVGLDPDRRQLPARYSHEAEPLWAWNRAVIEATAGLVAAYKPNIAFYEVAGDEGLRALRRTIDCAHAHGVPVILDAKRGDVGHSSRALARAAFELWGADAVTVSPYLGVDSIQPFTEYADKGVYVLCHTSNPGAVDLQEGLVGGFPLYLRVAELAQRWNGMGNVGLVVGATFPEALAAVRAAAPELPFLVPGVGAQGGDLEAAVVAGVNAKGGGLLVNASRAVACAEDPAAAATALRGALAAARSAAGRAPALTAEDRLAVALHEAGCVRFGTFTLHSGQVSPIYLDLRMLVSHPRVMALVAAAYSRLLEGLVFDRLAAIPYAALPIGSAVALLTGRPLIYPRREAKEYGTRRLIEGAWKADETVAVLDDLVTTGASKLEAIRPLQEAGLQVRDIVVLIDREQGGRATLEAEGYRVHAVLGLRQLVASLARQGRISDSERLRVQDYLGGSTS
ncbi:MAG: orotidine-5'-phosphate decarboxylase [Anaerolineae bacterium]